MIRSKGEAGTGDIVEAVRHMRSITRRDPPPRHARRDGAVRPRPRSCRRRYDLVRDVARDGKLPVPLFCAGGIATPADASLMMQLGAESVFVGSGIFKSADPERTRPRDRRGDDALRRRRARRRRPPRASAQAMASLEARKLDESQVLANRGW